MSFLVNSYIIYTFSNVQSITSYYTNTISDQYWDNTVLYLRGDKTVINDIYDSSLNKLPVVEFGDAQKNIMSPFNTIGESVDFRQTSNYLTVSGGSWFNFGSGNFTIECWIYATVTNPVYAGIFCKNNTGANSRITFNVSSLGNTAELWINKYSVSGPICKSSTIITDSTWHHLAAVRNNNVFTFFVDGLSGSTSNIWTGSIDDSSEVAYIGVDPFNFNRELNAVISNLRVTKGVALYTTNFNPASSVLTLISNGGATPSTLPTSEQVSLLLFNHPSFQQNNTFLDSSNNRFTITAFGNPAQGSFSPYVNNPTTSYSTITNGGSVYFNGTTDYITFPTVGVSAFQWSGDFTIEAFIYKFSASDRGMILSTCGNIANTGGVWFGDNNQNKLEFFSFVSNSTLAASTSTIPINQWVHIAATRNSGTLRLFINGVVVASVTDNTSYAPAGVNVGPGSIGAPSTNIQGFYSKGYVSNCRIIKGTAIYTSDFTPPTSPVTLTSNGGATPSITPTESQVSLLCNFTEAGIFDSTSKNNLITVGNAQVSTIVNKYGTGSIYFDGTGDELSIPQNINFEFGTGDFTIELWVYCTNLAGGTNQVMELVDFRMAQITEVKPTISISNSTFLYYANGSIRIQSGSISANTWYHVSVARSGGITKMFVNGTQVGSNYSDNNSYLISGPTIGSRANWIAGYDFVGYLDDIRITKGVARYTDNFTPPSRELPNISNLGLFVIKIDTTKTGTTSNTQFNLALKPSTTYDFIIDWGDNIVESLSSFNTTGYTHTYSTTGIYDIKILERSLGGFPTLYYNQVGDKDKLLNISQFGGNQFGTNWSNAFNGCTNLQITATDLSVARTQNITNFDSTWSQCTSLTSFPLIDTSKGKIFQNTWYSCYKLTSFPAINTVSATNLRQTWAYNYALTDFPLIQVPNCTSFPGTWSHCISLKSFPNIDFSNATNFGNEGGATATGIFEGCRSISSFNIPFSATRNVTSWDRAFLWCDNLTAVPILDYSKGTTFYATWMGPNKITTIPSNLTLSAGQNFTQAWRDCRLIKDFPDTYNFSSATNFSYAWYGCNALSSFPNLSAENATNFDSAWYNCSSLSSIKLTLLAKAINFSQSFYNCNSLRTFELSAPIATDLSTTFAYCTMLTGFILTAPKVTSLSYTWYKCTNLVNFPTPNINFSKVTIYDSAWRGCSKLIDFPLIDTLSAQNLNQTWMDCTSLTSFPLIDTRNVTIFNSTWQMTNIRHMPAIDTSKATSMNQTWWRCYNLISLQPLSTSNVTSLYRTWENCEKLSSFPLIDTSKVTNFYGAWYGCASLSSFPLIDTSKGTIFSTAWSHLINLSAFPALDFSNATKIAAAWANCYGLLSFPWIDTRNVNDSDGLYGTWANCNKLTTFPAINLSAHTGSLYDCWSNCTSLTSFPYIDIRNSTGLGYRSGWVFYTYGTWGNCRKLVTFPALSTGKVTSFNRTWMDCVSLTSFPLIDTLSGTDFTSTWQNCYSLSASDFPTLNMSKMTNGTNCFAGVKLTTTSYSALLTSICATNINTGVTFHGGNSTFNTAGSAAKVFLTTPIGSGGRGWTINDGGYQAGT